MDFNDIYLDLLKDGHDRNISFVCVARQISEKGFMQDLQDLITAHDGRRSE